MLILKRILAITAIVLSVIFLLLSLAGITGAWVVRDRANDAVNELFSLADRSLAAVSGRLEELIDRSSQAQDALGNMAAEVEKIGAGMEETPVVLQALDGLLGGKLVPAMEQLDQRSRQFYQDLGQLESALTALNSMRLFRDPDGFLDRLSTSVADFRSGMEQLDASLKEVESALQEKRSAVAEELVAALTRPLQRMQARLADSQAWLEGLNSDVERIQTELAAVHAGLLRLITLVTVIVTLALVWLGVSQVLAGLYAWELFRSLRDRPAPALAAGGDALAET